MNLELKHLAPYLPYGLMCKTITGVTGKMIQLSESSVFLDCEIKWNSGALYNWMLECDIKPILRPISDLYNHPADDEIKDSCNGFIGVKFFHVNDTPYCSLKVLLKHHFDIFGLIEAGLAIDINTLK
ncbi:hypothetical protein [Mucilaginibacter xinganensis]|uniref:Uncharacterized protein n=1 Tax=Mucilaginibacter xinganensis TaxID=1234841 RepID=A0A223NWZ9_9SPHI|nr:hypothetical protein [Mucilaginibacter xinganensis]ASU34385.1 hypothetical protein MuYL_2498 [Mucilaginibacter xinganensis]